MSTITDLFMDDAIDYGALTQSISYLLRRAQAKTSQEIEHYFEAFEIKLVQFTLLELIHHNAGLHQTALAGALGIQRTNMVGMLDTLEKRGLIERQTSRQDCRAHALHLTPKGQNLLYHLQRQLNHYEDNLRRYMGEEQFKQVCNNLATIAAIPVKNSN